jgi:hypothetical protein
MMPRPIPRLWLCLPPFVACWADVAATFVGQGRRYWAGDYGRVTEWNPLARELLKLHPLAFVIAAAGSCALVAAAVLLLNRRLALAAAFVVTFCHAAAAAAWAARAGPAGVVVAAAMLVGAERLTELSWRKGRRLPDGGETGGPAEFLPLPCTRGRGPG